MLAFILASRFLFFLAVVSVVIAAPIPRNLRNSHLMMNRDDSDSSSGSDSDSSSSSNTDNTSFDNDSTSTSGASFVADSSVDVAAVLQLVKSVTSNPVSGANYGTGHDDNKAQIYELDVDSSAGGSVYAFQADMDVDCDGTDVRVLFCYRLNSF